MQLQTLADRDILETGKRIKSFHPMTIAKKKEGNSPMSPLGDKVTIDMIYSDSVLSTDSAYCTHVWEC